MDTKIADVVYDLLIGEIELTNDMPMVENLFAEGGTCEELYSAVYAANLRICQRLGTAEDKDIELIIDSLLRISRLLGRQMFQYGMKYQSGEL